MIKIKLRDIVKLQYYYMSIFEAMDAEEGGYGKQELEVQKILDKITSDKEMQKKIWGIIAQGSWDNNDRTFKNICNKIRELGFEVLGE